MKQEQWSKCCFYLVTAPENTSSSAVVVVGDKDTYSVPLPQARRHLLTPPSYQAARPYGLQTPLSLGTGQPGGNLQLSGDTRDYFSPRFAFQTVDSTQNKKTQNGHKLPTQWPVWRHSWMRVIFDTPDLFISLTGTILTRIYSRTLGQLANCFIYMFLLSHLHIWTTACACGCTAIIYIWLHSHKPSVKSLGSVMARPKHERNHPFNLFCNSLSLTKNFACQIMPQVPFLK